MEALYELYQDKDVTRYMEDLFPDREEERVYLQNYYKNVYCFYGFGMWLLTKKDGTVIGRAGVEWNDRQEFVLGYMLGKKYQKQGYAREACEAILAYMRDALDITEIKAVIRKGNEASIRLAEKLGVRIELV